jgi:hypothetical protein
MSGTTTWWAPPAHSDETQRSGKKMRSNAAAPPQPARRRVVIVGAGFAGLGAGRTLSTMMGDAVEVVILEADELCGGRAKTGQVGRPALSRNHSGTCFSAPAQPWRAGGAIAAPWGLPGAPLGWRVSFRNFPALLIVAPRAAPCAAGQRRPCRAGRDLVPRYPGEWPCASSVRPRGWGARLRWAGCVSA